MAYVLELMRYAKAPSLKKILPLMLLRRTPFHPGGAVVDRGAGPHLCSRHLGTVSRGTNDFSEVQIIPLLLVLLLVVHEISSGANVNM